MRHPVDLAGGALLRYGPHRLRFFGGGWGDETVLGRNDLPSVPPQPIAIAWGREQPAGKVIVRDGWFDSPERLPQPTGRAAVRLIAPAAGHRRTCLLMAAWNDHAYATRSRLADALAEQGIAALLLQQPYYGTRRPDPEQRQPIQTVADFMTMGRAALAEGRALLATIAAEGREPGVSGYSMGGTMAALIAATIPFPIAIAPLAAAHSPAPVYLDGVLRHGIAWDALGDGEAPQRLRDIMLTASVLRLAPSPHVGRAVIVAARSDGYVPPTATQDLHRHWLGSELRLAPGGHATLLWYRTRMLAAAIADAFARTFG